MPRLPNYYLQRALRHSSTFTISIQRAPALDITTEHLPFRHDTIYTAPRDELRYFRPVKLLLYTMGRFIRGTSLDSSPTEKQKANPLPAFIASLSTIPITEAISHLSALAPDLQTHLSATGIRLVTHAAYPDPARLNYLARIYLYAGRRCAADRAPLATRLQHRNLAPHFERLYEQSAKQVKNAPLAGTLTGVREITIGCACCVGAPWVVIPMGERMDGAMYFEEEVYRELWGQEKEKGSLYGFDDEKNKMARRMKASREQVERAMAREKLVVAR
ncbi:hypothetical protein BDV95DRAFT_573908 [Massariosphaeria phaeospora]|uniref:Uncharacterized protein n=1 Tax=Massariosphaeria phaeospora TaxID=100035 RepID=A0A7C8I479_9PLEO|nr:hypothetical protein BDV95DRAFT_573908 [Massariosphaeria phaeospora]